MAPHDESLIAPFDTLDETLEQASADYVGRWNRLVSSTNWEKGAIIQQWRAALVEGGAPAAEYSDEAWSRRIGQVSPQHVGRLRRTFDRFGAAQASYAGLYWSHFQAALDWEDAEMWLEGAVQNDWSVSQMRSARLQTTQELTGRTAADDAAVADELDEDSVADDTAPLGRTMKATPSAVQDPSDERAEADLSEESDEEASGQGWHDSDENQEEESAEQVKSPPPFAGLPQLPDDLSEAFDMFKLAILRHRLARWSEVPAADVLTALSALSDLVVAPVED